MYLNAYLNPLDVLVLLSFDDLYTFKLVFPFWMWFMTMCFSFHVYAYFVKTLKYTWITLESFAFHANLFIKTRLCFRDMYVYLMSCQNIHMLCNIILLIKICDDFRVLKIYVIFKEYWTSLSFSWCHVSHNISTLTSFENYMDFMD